MEIVTYADARQNLAAIMNRVVGDAVEVVVTRQEGDAVVMVSLAEWNAIKETLHLLSSPKNGLRLLEAIRDLEAGSDTQLS